MPQAKKKAKTDSKPAAAKKPGPALSALEAALQPESALPFLSAKQGSSPASARTEL